MNGSLWYFANVSLFTFVVQIVFQYHFIMSYDILLKLSNNGLDNNARTHIITLHSNVCTVILSTL